MFVRTSWPVKTRHRTGGLWHLVSRFVDAVGWCVCERMTYANPPRGTGWESNRDKTCRLDHLHAERETCLNLSPRLQ